MNVKLKSIRAIAIKKDAEEKILKGESFLLKFLLNVKRQKQSPHK